MNTLTNFSFHRATVTDSHILVDNIVAFSKEYNGGIDPEVEQRLRESQLQYFSHALTDNSYIGWYAKCGDEVTGIGGLCIRHQPGNIRNISGRVGYVFSMYTVPEFRRQGICSVLLNKLIETARDMVITAFELHATTEGEPVYVQGGFELFKEPTYRKYML